MSKRKLLTVGIIGTRGIPNRYGGFERFTELLVGHSGWETENINFIIYGESPNSQFNAWTSTKNIGINKSKNGISFYRKSAVMAADKCDIVISCGVGISIFALMVRLRGAILVVNPDGCEWRRSKWSIIGRLLIRAMYWPALAAAQYIIIDAEALREDFGLNRSARTRYIGYQAPEPHFTPLKQETIQALALSNQFVLCIARLEPENNIDMVVEAFLELVQDDLDLLIVGPTSTPHYFEKLMPFQTKAPRVRFLGAIFDQNILDELRSNCVAYVHGHSVGGTNPSLLEALASVGGAILCHDNKYNKEVAGSRALYFDGPTQLAEKLGKLDRGISSNSISLSKIKPDSRFEPDNIYRLYRELFEEIRATR